MSADLLQRVNRGEPAAMRRWFEDGCRADRIVWEYSADGNWYALPRRRYVRVPPLADRVALAIAAHEKAHVVVGPCPRTGEHRDTRTGCLACEAAAWAKVIAWLPLDIAMHKRMRTALGSYRNLPASDKLLRLTGPAHLAGDFLRLKRLEGAQAETDRLIQDVEASRRRRTWRDERLDRHINQIVIYERRTR